MDKITFQLETGESVDFFVLEQTKLNGFSYILVTEDEEGDGEALILKDLAKPEDNESLYEIVSDEAELGALVDVFESLLEDIDLEEPDQE